MKLSLRAAAVPRWDFLAAATAAKTYGYDGVELRASLDAAEGTATNILFSDPKKIREIYSEAGVQISSIEFAPSNTRDSLADVIGAAAALGAAAIRIYRPDAQAHPRGFDAFAARILPFADTAAVAGITLLLENEAMAGSVSRLWQAIDGFNHPSIACCWNPNHGQLAQELPLVSIPMLNSRIRMMRFGDIHSPGIPTQKILQRLAGIGFGGWVLVENMDEETIHTQAQPCEKC